MAASPSAKNCAIAPASVTGAIAAPARVEGVAKTACLRHASRMAPWCAVCTVVFIDVINMR